MCVCLRERLHTCVNRQECVRINEYVNQDINHNITGIVIINISIIIINTLKITMTF